MGCRSAAFKPAAKSPIRDQTLPRELLKAAAASFLGLCLTSGERARKIGQSHGIAAGTFARPAAFPA
jgi:hypothetical protein